MQRVLVALVLLVVACGGPEPLGIEDYVESVASLSGGYQRERQALTEAYLDELEVHTAALQRNADQTDTEAMASLSGEALKFTKQETTRLFASIGDALARFADGVETLGAPATLEPVHDEMVRSIQLAAEGVPSLLDAVAAADGFDALDAAIAGSVFSDAQPRLDAACRALEAKAAAHGVRADVRCGG